MKKVLITGGHLTPALALIEELQKDNVKIVFIGRKHAIEGSKELSTEYDQINKLKIKFYPLTTGRIQRKFTRHTVPSLAKIPMGFIQSFFYLLLIRPNVTVSFGGYLSTPVVISSWLLGIPTITHEQATKVGLANRINAIFCTEFLCSWPIRDVENAKVIGNPTRKLVSSNIIKDKKLELFIKSHKKVLFITGGSLGSHVINNVVYQALPKLKNWGVIHQIGTANYKNDHQKAQNIKSKDYYPVPYLNDDFGAALNNARIVVSRSGANTIWELAIKGKVSLLVPLPISGQGEQWHNAKLLSSANTCLLLDQKNLTVETLLTNIKKLDSNYDFYQQKAKKFQTTLKTNAAKTLKDFVVKYLND